MPAVTSMVLLGVAAATAAGAAGYQASESVTSGRIAKNAQQKLEEERKAQLAQEAKTRAEAKLTAESAGTRAGRGSMTSGGPAQTGPVLGFGSGNTPTGAPKSNLFGN